MDYIYFLSAAVGGWILIKLLSFVRLFFSLFLLPALLTTIGQKFSKFGKNGSWAVITGASDGLGKEFSYQLASKGFNVILVSRTLSKLEAVAAEIQQEYSVQCKMLAMDFTKNKDSDYDRLAELIDGLNIAVLVNNVGLSHEMPVPFLETPSREMESIIMVNCLGTLRVTKLVAPVMVQRRRGLILTMASFGGMLPTPLLATYSGSKAFLQQWSTALGSELAPQGVQVQLVQSYLVTTAMSKIRKASIFVPTAKDFVRATLGRIGRSGSAQGISFTLVPYWTHAVMHWALVNFIGTMNKPFLAYNKSMHEKIRQRALRKQARNTKIP